MGTKPGKCGHRLLTTGPRETWLVSSVGGRSSPFQPAGHDSRELGFAPGPVAVVVNLGDGD